MIKSLTVVALVATIVGGAAAGISIYDRFSRQQRSEVDCQCSHEVGEDGVMLGPDLAVKFELRISHPDVEMRISIAASDTRTFDNLLPHLIEVQKEIGDLGDRNVQSENVPLLKNDIDKTDDDKPPHADSLSLSR